MSIQLSDHSHDLQSLARLASQPRQLDEVLEGALASLKGIVDYDLAAVYRLRGTTARVVAASGPLASELVRRHSVDVCAFPTLRRALETRAPVLLEEHHHASEEGDPYDGLLDLPPGHGCMVVPLFAEDETLGMITLDRAQCGVFSRSALEIAGVYGQLIALALAYADQARLLDRYRHQLREEHRLLQEEVGRGHQAVDLLEASASAPMRSLVRLAKQVAASDLPVLVLGETGTGKELLAEAIHAWSPRADGPFVTLNCAAIPESLVESELFGHVRGAFSGADTERQGRFVTANGGTLLLDEVGDMPLAAQAKLLRVLQEGTFQPVGSDQTVKVDVRVVASTHVDLEAAVADGRFREDLYYRLAVFPLTLPPLRDRVTDVGVIAAGLLDAWHRRTGRGPWTLDPKALAALQAQRWPGNVRQLANTLERATILQPRGSVGLEHVGLGAPGPAPSSPTSPGQVESWRANERRYFERLLAHADGQIAGDGGAAALAGLKPSTLRSRLAKHGLV